MRKRLVIISIVLVVLLLISSLAVYYVLYGISGNGKCKIGEALKFEGKFYEQCVQIGKKADVLIKGDLEIKYQTLPGHDNNREFAISIEKVGQEIELYGEWENKVTVKEVDTSYIILELSNLYDKDCLSKNTCLENDVEIKLNKTVVLVSDTEGTGDEWQITYK